jgi:hypothetical protein
MTVDEFAIVLRDPKTTVAEEGFYPQTSHVDTGQSLNVESLVLVFSICDSRASIAN